MQDQVTDNAAAAVVALYNHRVINWENFVEKRDDLISNLLLSIGKANLAQLEDVEDGVRNLTALAVMTAMSIKYDTLTAPTMTKWKKTLIAEFDGRDSLENLMATHTKIHANFLRVGQPLSEYDKLCTLQAAVAQHPTVLKVIRMYTNEHPNIVDQTFAALVGHVTLHAPHITMTAHELGLAVRLAPSEAPQALTEARVSELLAQALAVLSKDTRANRGGGRGSHHGRESRAPLNAAGRSSGRGGNVGSVGNAPTRIYCYVHGYDSHRGSECRTILHDRDFYTNRYRRAASHSVLEGGSVHKF